MWKITYFKNIPKRLFFATLSVVFFFLVIIFFIMNSGFLIYRIKDIDNESFKLMFLYRELRLSDIERLTSTNNPDRLKVELETSIILFEKKLTEFLKFKKYRFIDKKIKKNINMLENSWAALKIQINKFLNDLEKINNLLSGMEKPANHDFIKIYYELLEKIPSAADKETLDKLKDFFLKYADIDFNSDNFYLALLTNYRDINTLISFYTSLLLICILTVLPFAIFFSVILIMRINDREEKKRLQKQVDEKTGDLHAINERLIQELENIKTLTAESHEKEEKYRLLFESSFDAIMVFDLINFHILDANSATYALFNYKKEDLLNNIVILDFFTEETINKEQLLKSPGIRKIPFCWNKKKEGTPFPAEITIGTIFIKNEKKGFIIVKDISENVRKNLKQNMIIKKMQSLFEDINSFSDFIAIDVNSLKPKKYLIDYGITQQEDRVIYYVIQGLSNKEIAGLFSISIDTVKKHVSSILRKLMLKNRHDINRFLNANNIAISYKETSQAVK